jgi:multiple antibiotic resistance protein
MIHGAVHRVGRVTRHYRCVQSFDLADTFVTFLALLGPQKVLLYFARLGHTIDVRSVRMVAVYSAGAATVVGVACALAAPWLAAFFHIGAPALQLAAGAVFFIYAVGLVLGFHFGEDNDVDPEGADAEHPVVSGLRQLLLPYIVSPLAVAAEIEESLAAHNWTSRWVIAAAFAAVAVLDGACAWVFAPLLKRAHPISLEILSRLLGVLLAAVGVQLLLSGLAALGAHLTPGH